MPCTLNSKEVFILIEENTFFLWTAKPCLYSCKIEFTSSEKVRASLLAMEFSLNPAGNAILHSSLTPEATEELTKICEDYEPKMLYQISPQNASQSLVLLASETGKLDRFFQFSLENENLSLELSSKLLKIDGFSLAACCLCFPSAWSMKLYLEIINRSLPSVTFEPTIAPSSDNLQ